MIIIVEQLTAGEKKSKIMLVKRLSGLNLAMLNDKSRKILLCLLLLTVDFKEIAMCKEGESGPIFGKFVLRNEF